MPFEHCDICLNNGRPVKYISGRIQVCQWCVSLLQDTPLNPIEIEKHLLSILIVPTLRRENDMLVELSVVWCILWYATVCGELGTWVTSRKLGRFGRPLTAPTSNI